MHKFLIMLLLAAFSNVAMADWASGGGELLMDANNPWFVQNTSEVRYCVSSDDAVFGVPLARAEILVEQAIAYWKSEFAYSRSVNPNFDVQVATQNFVRVPCSSTFDLAFQLGFLTTEQQAAIVRPQHYVSLAIRTEYDKVNMRGRGFIYIAPERGLLKPEGDYLVDTPWSDFGGVLLRNVLVHELGHVFGIPHVGEQQNIFEIMNAGYPEYILSRSRARILASSELPSFFGLYKGGKIISHCERTDPVPDVTRRFLGLQAHHNCFEAVYEGDETMAHGNVTIYGKASKVATKELVGTAELEAVGRHISEEIVRVWLPREQKVFRLDPSYPPPLSLVGPKRRHWEKRGTYVTADGSVRRQIVASLSQIPTRQRLMGVLDDKILLDLEYGF